MQIRLYCHPIKTLLLLGKSTSPSHRCGHWRILSQVIVPIFLYDLPESYIIALARAKSLPQILGLGPEGVSGHAFCHVTLESEVSAESKCTKMHQGDRALVTFKPLVSDVPVN